MKALWGRLAARVDQASLRERALIFAALVALIVALADSLLIEREFMRQKQLNREIVQRQSDIAALQDQLAKSIAARQASPDRSNKERLDQLLREINALEAKITEEQRRFTRPEQMRTVLEEMLGRNRKVSLLDMKTLESAEPAGTIVAKPASPDAKPAAGGAKPAPAAERQVYRHGLEITVSGSYLDLLAYVSDLERLPTRLYWGGAEMDASSYPVIRLRLTVFTLSLDKAWLSV